jgi:hypothetical protein
MIIILLKMNKKVMFWGLVALALNCAGTFAQETTAAQPQIFINLAQKDGESGRIEIIQPIQVEHLLKMQIANNRLQEGIPGYRIQIFSGSGQTARQRAIDLRREFRRTYPDIEAYWEYNTPNDQVFVGDFRTKNEALRELKKIVRAYPRAFIVSETIQIAK